MTPNEPHMRSHARRSYGARFSVRVIPRSSKNEIIKQPDGNLKAYISAAPTDGKANKALIDLLAKHFKVRKRDIRIKSGKQSRNKIVEVIN